MAKHPYKPRAPLSLADAVSQVITDLGGAPAAAALPGVRVSKSTLFKYADDADDNRAYVMPMDVAAVLSAEAVRQGKDPLLLYWLRDQVEREAVAEPIDATLHKLMSRLGQDASQVFADLAEVVDPKGDSAAQLTARERDKLLKDLAEVHRAASAGIAALMR